MHGEQLVAAPSQGLTIAPTPSGPVIPPGMQAPLSGMQAPHPSTAEEVGAGTLPYYHCAPYPTGASAQSQIIQDSCTQGNMMAMHGEQLVEAPSQGMTIAPTPSGPVIPPGMQAPLSGMQVPFGGIQVTPGGMQVPLCGMQAYSGGMQVPPGGMQVPPGGMQAPPGGMQAPPGGMQVLPGGMQFTQGG